METLGAYPAGGSPALQADWLARAGQAAVYREVAGITDPRQVLGPIPEGHPELAAAHAGAVTALELQDPSQFIWAIPRAELETQVATYQRIQATAPREVSAELRAERLAEADARVRALELRAQGQAELAAQAEARADAGAVRATELEGHAEKYTAWTETTADERAAAELAQAELERRGTTRVQIPKDEPELAVGERTSASQPKGQQAEVRGIEEPNAGTEDLKVIPTAEAEDSAVDALVADMDEAVGQLPALDTATVSGASSARMQELDARRAARAETDADAVQRNANREAYVAAEASASGPERPSAWVQGPAKPAWGSPRPDAPETEKVEPEVAF
jgi:hypothetical protein